MGKLSKADKKIAYDAKLCQLLDDYTQVLIVAADNVGSNQLQNIRKGLRGDSIVLMGKNTMMKRSIRIHSDNTGNKAFLNLIPLLVVRPFFFLKKIYRTVLAIYRSVLLVLFEIVVGFFFPNFSFFRYREMLVWFSPRVIWRRSVRRLPSTRYFFVCFLFFEYYHSFLYLDWFF